MIQLQIVLQADPKSRYDPGGRHAKLGTNGQISSLSLTRLRRLSICPKVPRVSAEVPRFWRDGISYLGLFILSLVAGSEVHKRTSTHTVLLASLLEFRLALLEWVRSLLGCPAVGGEVGAAEPGHVAELEVLVVDAKEADGHDLQPRF